MNFKLGELFCGPGGIATGAKLASEQFAKNNECDEPIQHTWGVDIDSTAIDTYSTNIGGEGVCTDAILFTSPNDNSDEKQISDFNKITALAFGFPCNDFSMVGQQRGIHGSYGGLYKAGINAINESNPKFFVAENVSGIHSANEGATFQKILEELKESGKHGYTVTTHLYKFEEYGVPQARHRYIIVGIRNNFKLEFKVPEPTTPQNHLSAKKAIMRSDKFKYNIEKTKQSDKVKWRLLFTPPGVNAWKLDEAINYGDKQLYSYLKINLPWFDKEIKKLGNIDSIRKKIEYCRLHCTKAKMSHIYKRLTTNKPSYTVTGSGGGGTHVYHWEEPRALTNRERARLQSFPDDFEFKGTKEQVRKQIGMAVPPDGAKVIFESILKTFAGIEYNSIDSNYKPLTEEEIKKRFYQKFRGKVGQILKENHKTSISKYKLTREQFKEWIDKGMSLSEVVEEILTLN